MPLPGSLFSRIHTAILDAFSYDDLHMALRLGLDWRLDILVPQTSYSDQVFHLLESAERRSNLLPLLHCLAAARPNRSDLAALYTEAANVVQPAEASVQGNTIGNTLYLPPEERPPLWVNVPTLRNLDQIEGRAQLIDELADRLCRGQSPALSTDGKGGVGKTTLAILLAYHSHVREHFPDGVLWASPGPGQDKESVAAAVASIQAAWAAAVGALIDNIAQPARRQQRIVQALAGRRVLVVLDDVWQAQTAELLRCALPGVGHILTTRSQEIARAFGGPAAAVHVPELELDPAYDLLQQLAPEACATDPAATRRLASAVGGLPLAIELLGGYLSPARSQHFAGQRQAAIERAGDPQTRLALAAARLGTDGAPAMTLAAVLDLSVAALAEPQQAAFCALGAFAAKPARFDLAAAQAVTAADAETLGSLIDANLLECDADEQLAVHQVLADAARLQMPAAAAERHDRYYHGLIEANREDWQRIEAVYEQARHALERLAEGDERTVPWVWALCGYWDRRGLRQEQLHWEQQALSVTQSQDNISSQAALLHSIGGVYSALGEKQQALQYYEQALMLIHPVGDKRGEATILTGIGGVYDALGEKQQALAYYEQALPLTRQVDHKRGEATILTGIGWVYSTLGEKQQALAYYKQALQIRRQVGDKWGEATTLNDIGLVYSELCDQQRALQYHEQALSLFRHVGDKRGEAYTLTNIGLVYSDMGEKQRALQYHEQALPLMRQVGDKGGEAATLTNVGGVYDALGKKQQALQYYEQALPLMRQVGDKRGEAYILDNIGGVYSALGDKQQALQYYELALPLRRQVGDKRGEAQTLNNIGLVYSALGDKQQALAYYKQALPLSRQVGDKRGEATTLANIGLVYSDLGDVQRALEYYEQALPLSRQVGDRFGESVTRFNIAMAAAGLGNLNRAVSELENVVALDEAIQHPDLASDRAALELLRLLRSGESTGE